jgi:hypothetical protein
MTTRPKTTLGRCLYHQKLAAYHAETAMWNMGAGFWLKAKLSQRNAEHHAAEARGRLVAMIWGVRWDDDYCS